MELIDCIEEKEIKEIKRLFFVKNPINLCKLPYPGHKNGCPNVGKSQQCPPHVIRLEKKYDLTKPCYFVYIKFNIKKQEKRMLKLNPGWTKKQARCLLYWQPCVKKELKKLGEFYTFRKNKSYELIPEAMGLHVFETAQHIGINLERNYSEQKYIYKIAFMGVLNAIT